MAVVLLLLVADSHITSVARSRFANLCWGRLSMRRVALLVKGREQEIVVLIIIVLIHL